MWPIRTSVHRQRKNSKHHFHRLAVVVVVAAVAALALLLCDSVCSHFPTRKTNRCCYCCRSSSSLSAVVPVGHSMCVVHTMSFCRNFNQTKTTTFCLFPETTKQNYKITLVFNINALLHRPWGARWRQSYIPVAGRSRNSTELVVRHWHHTKIPLEE
jgi:hypothetical protein